MPTAQDVADANARGAQAARMGREFKTDCPYTYNNFPGMSYAEFNALKRPLMDAWFAGWISIRRAGGAG